MLEPLRLLFKDEVRELGRELGLAKEYFTSSNITFLFFQYVFNRFWVVSFQKLSILCANRSVGRHPFPGPGLAIRIMGEVNKEHADILRQADHIFITELRAAGELKECFLQ